MRFLLAACFFVTPSFAFAQQTPTTPVPAPAASASAPAPATAQSPAPDPNAVILKSRPQTQWWTDKAYDKPITLALKNMELQDAISALSTASGLNIMFSGGYMSHRKASVTFTKAPLRDVMLAVADLYNLTWYKRGDVHILTWISHKTERAPKPVVLAPMAAPVITSGVQNAVPAQSRYYPRKPRTYTRKKKVIVAPATTGG